MQILSIIYLEPFCLLRVLYREPLHKVYLICIIVKQFLKDWQMLYSEDLTESQITGRLPTQLSLLYNKFRKIAVP